MKLNHIITKDVVIAKLEVYVEGYYSGSKAYGEIYMPIEIYEENKELIDEIEVSVYELDGKHSEVTAEVEVIINTLESFLLNTNINEDYSDDYKEDLTEDLYEELEFLKEGDVLTTKHLTHKVIKLAVQLNEEKEVEICLNKNWELDGMELPQGTIIKATKPIIIKEGILFTI